MLSLVVPIYNEEIHLREVVNSLVVGLNEIGCEYEIIIVENGSNVETKVIAQALAEEYPRIRVLFLPKKNYGDALRHGFLSARGDFISHASIDFYSREFIRVSLRELENHAIVIGSKVLGSDARPLVRKLGSLWFHGLVRAMFKVNFTDTHGIKSFRKNDIVPFVRDCISNGDMFDTELLIRAHRAGLKIIEVPVSVNEKKGFYAISPVRLIRRFLAALLWLLKLRMTLR